jgi:hypothetical protein
MHGEMREGGENKEEEKCKNGIIDIPILFG